MIEPVEGVSENESGCRMFRLRRDAAGFAAGDLLLVVPGAEPEGGEFVVDLRGRLSRHGGGPVWGVVVGVVRGGAAARAAARIKPRQMNHRRSAEAQKGGG